MTSGLALLLFMVAVFIAAAVGIITNPGNRPDEDE